jgi:hypothetical protein
MDEPKYPQSDLAQASEAMHMMLDELLRPYVEFLTPVVTWLAKHINRISHPPADKSYSPRKKNHAGHDRQSGRDRN